MSMLWLAVTFTCICTLWLSARAATCDFTRCRNGGTCHEGPNSKSVCECKENFYGRLCEKVNPCLAGNICFNGGRCEFSRAHRYGFLCICPKKFKGFRCQFVDPCSEGELCNNGGECYSYYSGSKYQHTCFCPPTHYGGSCEKESVCMQTKCYHGGQCYGTTQAYCVCPRNYTGQLCERKRCSADLSTCGYIHQLGDTTYSSCSNIALQQYKNITSCRKSHYESIVKKKDCACLPEDLHTFFTDHVGSPMEARACWYCLRVYASHPSSCSNRTTRCGRLLLQSVLNWSDGNQCSQSQMDLRNEELSCVEDILSGNMDMENCDMYEYFFNTTSRVLRQQVLLKCSGCDLSSISKECVTAEFTTRPEEFCKMNYLKMKNCMLGKMEATPICKSVIPPARRFLDLNMQVALKMWKPVCSKFSQFENLRKQWNCREEKEKITATTINRQRRSTDPLSVLSALFWQAL